MYSSDNISTEKDMKRLKVTNSGQSDQQNVKSTTGGYFQNGSNNGSEFRHSNGSHLNSTETKNGNGKPLDQFVSESEREKQVVSPSLLRRRRRLDRNSDALHEFYKHAENIRNGIARSEDNLAGFQDKPKELDQFDRSVSTTQIAPESFKQENQLKMTSDQHRHNEEKQSQPLAKSRVRKRDSMEADSEQHQKLNRKGSRESMSGRATPTHGETDRHQRLNRRTSKENLSGRETPTFRDFQRQFSNESHRHSYRGSCDSLTNRANTRRSFRGSSDSLSRKISSGRETPELYAPTFQKRENYDKPWLIHTGRTSPSPTKQKVSRKASLDEKRRSMESPVPSQPYTPDLHKRETYEKPWQSKPVSRKTSMERQNSAGSTGLSRTNSETKLRRSSSGTAKRKENSERHPDQLRIGCTSCMRRHEMQQSCESPYNKWNWHESHDSMCSLENYRYEPQDDQLDLEKLLTALHSCEEDLAESNVHKKAKSEDEAKTEKEWLDAEKVWLVHKGGFAGAYLLKPDASNPLPEGKIRIRLEASGDVLEVEEDDIEKANPPQFDRAEDLASLRYLNESSALHTLRQRFAGNLIHTYGGPSLVVINPMQSLPLYSEKLIQMLKGCKQEDMPPHVFSMAQIAHREMLSTRRDQSIIMMGRSGSGKTTNAKHIMSYLTISAGSVNSILTGEKVTAISVLTDAFGNCRTLLNTNASRFTQLFTIDFDHSGQIASASIQVMNFEKSRVVRRPEGEPTFNIFYEMLAGLDSQFRNELQLQVLNETNLFMTPLQKNDDRQKATQNWAKVIHSFGLIGVSEDEYKALISVLAAIYHLGVAGATKGNNNKAQFARPAAAQKAASLLGTTSEELSRSIFSPPGSSTLTRNTSMRVPNANDRNSINGEVTSPALEALEGFVIGLYSDVFNAVISLINRSMSSNIRTANSIIVLDSPGFQNPASCGRPAASFEDLCQNYTQERLQLLFHDLTFTLQQDRYAQEDIECDFDFVTTSPAAMVSLFDKSPQQSLLRSSNQDLRDAEKKGLLWILDEEAIYPGATEDSFMERFFSHHGEHPVRRESLLRKGAPGHTFILNHFQGTCPVQYNAAGWLKSCRENPVSRNSLVLLQDSKKHNMSQLFTSVKAPVAGMVSGSIAGMEGASSLRRVGSMRRTYMSSTAGLKKKSLCLQIKFQVDSIIETIRRTRCHFLHCMVAQNNAGLCELRGNVQNGDKTKDEQLMNVPLVRSQLRGFEILDAVRVFRQGFPDHMQFSEFRQKFEVLLQPDKRPGKNKDEKKAVTNLMDYLDIDKLNYRIGLSQVFFRPGALAQLEISRDEKITGNVTAFQALCRGHLARQKLDKLRIQHLAVSCIQRNVKKYVKIRDWEWWKLYTKIKPVLNVHKTEEDLLNKEFEIEQMKMKIEKLEKERNEYKTQCDKYENRLSELSADLVEENSTSNQATELLEAETAERMRLEKENKEIQAKLANIKRQNEKLQMEVMESRLWNASSVEMEDELDGAGDSIYKERYERMVKELEFTKKRLQQQHEEEMDSELQSRRLLEKRLHDTVEEAEEQRRLVQVARKKAQRLTEEMQDTKLHLEERMSRNNELERKQRRFDAEINMAHEDVKEEKQHREKLQKERDSLMTEKYALEQSVMRVKMDFESQLDKTERLEKELKDIIGSSSGKDDQELVALKRLKHELERKLKEQEEELDDQAGQIQHLEQAKLRIEMSIEKMKQQYNKDLEEKEEELEDMRCRTQKKLKSMEQQVEEEYEEKKRVQEEKALLERQLLELGSREPQRDIDNEKRLKRHLKKTKALLHDASTTLHKQKTADGVKSQIAQLRNKLDDAEFSSAAAIKGKKRMELEMQDLNQQIEDLSRAKQESENKCMSVLREKADLQNRIEENEEDMAEIMKKYKAAVQQQSVDHITISDQLRQIEEMSSERETLKQTVNDLSTKVTTFETSTVDKHSVTRLEGKIRELENKLQLESTSKQRLETQITRLKEHLERLQSEKEELNSSKLQTEELSKRNQKQLRELREELVDAQKREMEASQGKKELITRIEELEADQIQNQSDLKLAFKRIADLQAALEEEIDSDNDSLLLDSEDEEDDSDFDSFLENHNQSPIGRSSLSSYRTRSQGSSISDGFSSHRLPRIDDSK
ncbi:hypothetical protein SNE40_003722 [Patella caerulea]|uniref:Myosin motor domain-containing protein n=2 Tax=Patella caerulea TaxID=87958 RepID=A0AAN8Q0K3_PATCE